MASQMAPAKILKTTIEIPVNDHVFLAKGEVVSFDGFLKVYPTSTKDKILPDISVGEQLEKSIQARQKFSRPPARYTEASLVRKIRRIGDWTTKYLCTNHYNNSKERVCGAY